MIHIAFRGVRSQLLVLAAVLPAACGGSVGGDAVQTARAPEKAGDVYELDGVEQRANAGASVLAYVEGLHVMVLDGNDAYAGMSKLRAEKGADGLRTFHLSGGLEASIVSSGDNLQLRFSSGETIPLKKRDPNAGGTK